MESRTPLDFPHLHHLQSRSCRAGPLWVFCNENTNINSSSQISVTIDSLLAQVVSKTSLTGYIATSSGRDPDKVYGLSLCRGDVSSKDCSSCIQDAAKQIRQRCPNQADARIWYDYCFLRSEALMPMNEGLGKRKTKLSPFLTLYALVQCTRDLSQIDCAQCLAIAVGNFPNFCYNRKGCRVLYSSCYVRYELYPFFFALDSDNGTSFGRTEVIFHP
ncbi:hypothetical protein DITRI_Ditri11bG0058200 [Diplodiscus trichospermus]